jgi:energy-converting hydrogenase Eha subunit A
MMIPEYFAVIGAVIGSIGGFYYLYETITGKTKPNRVTWLLWWLFPTITFIAQRAQGVKALSWATFVAGFCPFLIVLASFLNEKAYWKTEPRDYYLMVGALLGIILWFLTSNPNIAILFSLIADLLAGLPTLIKAYRHPETESWIAYAISTFGFGLGVLAIPSYTFENYAFIGYLFALNCTLAVLASRKHPKSLPTS